jgi:hypothetical protein
MNRWWLSFSQDFKLGSKKSSKSMEALGNTTSLEKNTHIFTVQATSSWKDRKQVGFLHNNLVQPTKDYFVKQYVKNKACHMSISSHEIVSYYSKHMNCVNHKDRDTADWTVSLKSNWWYLRIFYLGSLMTFSTPPIISFVLWQWTRIINGTNTCWRMGDDTS